MIEAVTMLALLLLLLSAWPLLASADSTSASDTRGVWIPGDIILGKKSIHCKCRMSYTIHCMGHGYSIDHIIMCKVSSITRSLKILARQFANVKTTVLQFSSGRESYRD